MFILTQQTNNQNEVIPIDLPDLAIQDYITRQGKKVACTKDWDEDFIQATSIIQAPLEFVIGGLGLITGGNTKGIWSRRASNLVVSTRLSDSLSEVVFYVKTYDKNQHMGILGPYSLSALPISDKEGKFLGVDQVLPIYGASRVSVYVESITFGTIDIYLACV